MDEELDLNRYQTVYAKHNGSVAAPTAGLHFDETLLSHLRAKGVNMVYTTLHVGAGTFRQFELIIFKIIKCIQNNLQSVRTYV